MSSEHIWRGDRPLRRSQSRDGSVIEPGEAFDPTDRELEHLGDDIETTPADAKAAQGDSDGVSPPFDPTDLSVREVRERLQEAAYTDAELRALADAERDGGARTTALDAIGV